jgi:hypothetical protein
VANGRNNNSLSQPHPARKVSRGGTQPLFSFHWRSVCNILGSQTVVYQTRHLCTDLHRGATDRSPGTAIPGVLGPTNTVFELLSCERTRTISSTGILSVTQTIRPMPAPMASSIASAAFAGGTRLRRNQCCPQHRSGGATNVIQ